MNLTSKQKIFFTLGAIICILGILIYTMIGSSSDSNSQDNNFLVGQFSRDPSTMDERLYPMGIENNIWDEALSPFQEDGVKSYLEILEDLQSGKINFVWEVWGMRSKCPKDYTASQCDATILAFIDRNYQGGERERLRDLYISYFKYEAAIQKFEIPDNLNFADRYELIKSKRRELLGDEKSKLFFGMEEAQVEFIDSSYNFIQSSKNMNPDQRVKKYEELKKKTYSFYYDNMIKREDKFDHYNIELQLREAELQGLTDLEREQKLSKLELKYFGKEKADLIAKARKEEREEQSRILLVQEKEADFLRNNPNLSESEKQKKIQAIRSQILGEEGAEMYSRRIKFEEETKNLN